MAEATKGLPVAEIPNQTDAGGGAGGGFFPWLFPQGAPTPTPGSLTPKEMQNIPAGSANGTSANGTNAPGAPPGAIHAPAPVEAPEEEPTPAYNAPPSFWDKMLGEGETINTYPSPGDKQ